MAYVATRRLRFGDGWIEPGEPVPVEEGRNYASLLTLGHIAEVKATEQMSDKELAAEVERLRAENEQLQPTTVEVPDGVTPGITPGWPTDAVTGTPLALTDDQRTELAEKEILPVGTEEEPVKAIVTLDGELVVVSAPEQASEDAGEAPEGTSEAESADEATGESKKEEPKAAKGKSPKVKPKAAKGK